MQDNIVNNFRNHGSVALSFDDKVHIYDTNELPYKVLETINEKNK